MIKRATKTAAKKITVDVESFGKPNAVIEVFDFKENWHLVEPHLNDPHILSLLDKGMKRFSIHHKWSDLPDWDRRNGIGPWQYSKFDAHSQEALAKVNGDPEWDILWRKYEDICEKIGINFEELDLKNDHPKVKAIADYYQEEWNRIEEKYLPKPNTYKWYQCFGACFFLSKWQKALAETVFPDFKWRTIENRPCSDTNSPVGGHSTTVGVGPNGKKMIFDILLFDNTAWDKILEAAAVDATKL